jgi:hypothetical protein
MRKHGVIGKQIINVEKIVMVEDKEKMQEMERRLEKERGEMKFQIEEEKKVIE